MRRRRSSIDGWPCRLLGLVLWLGMAGLTPAALGQDAARNATAALETAEPAFFLDEIRIDGLKRATREVILSEARLETGRAYSEEQLRDAVHRIQRLPFILDAELALRRGSERGQYQLVIEVQESLLWFFGVQLRGYVFDDFVSLTSSSRSDRESNWLVTAGMRYFVGKNGMAFAAYGGDSFLQAGYTHYDLFDRGIVGTVAWTRHVCCPVRVFSLGLDPTFSSWSLRDGQQIELAVAAPLQGNQSLDFSLLHLEADDGLRQRAAGSLFTRVWQLRDLRYQRAELDWVHNTTDDNLLPRLGSELRGGVFLSRLRADVTPLSSFLDPADFVLPPPVTVDSRQFGLAASARHYWPLTDRQTLSAGGRVSLGRAQVDDLPRDFPASPPTDSELTNYELNLRVGHAISLWSPSTQRRRHGQLRFETSVEWAQEGTSPDLDLPDNPLQRLDLSAGLVLRNRWGLFRLSFSYVQLEGQE